MVFGGRQEENTTKSQPTWKVLDFVYFFKTFFNIPKSPSEPPPSLGTSRRGESTNGIGHCHQRSVQGMCHTPNCLPSSSCEVRRLRKVQGLKLDWLAAWGGLGWLGLAWVCWFVGVMTCSFPVLLWHLFEVF